MKRGLLLLLVAAAVWPLAAEQSGNPSTDAAKAVANLRWRSIGPNNFAGRIVDIVFGTLGARRRDITVLQ